MKKRLKKFLAPANIINVIKKIIFYEIAALIGIIIALKLFFPGDFVISKINEAMLKTDYSVKAVDSYYSPLKTVSFDDFSLLESGKKIIGVQGAQISPSLGTMLGLSKSVDFVLNDFNSSGGELAGNVDVEKASVCFDVDAEDVSFLLLKTLLPDMAGKGTLNGTVSFCRSKKMNGEIDITGNNLVFGGKIKGLTVKPLKLGTLSLHASIKDNKLTIKKADISGALKINITGKVVLNPTRLNFSRPEIVVTVIEKEKGTIASLSPIDLALEQFKDEKEKQNLTYRFSVKGMFTNPTIKKERSK